MSRYHEQQRQEWWDAIEPLISYEGEYAFIPVGEHQVIVDIAMLPFLKKYRWYAEKRGNTFYVRAHSLEGDSQRLIYLHRFITELTDPKIQADHINGNGLDNRKSNLRICTNAQNCRNRKSPKTDKSKSIYKGVAWDTANRKWRALITFNYKAIHIGRFDDEEEAARAYDKKARELHGEFAFLNFKESSIAV